jgi:signal peptidase I
MYGYDNSTYEVIMPGRIMTAQQAKREYKKFRSIKKRGNTITLKNSSGEKVTVNKNARVYHRGHGKFGLYSNADDAKRYKPGAIDRVGKGSRRHTHD